MKLQAKWKWWTVCALFAICAAAMLPVLRAPKPPLLQVSFLYYTNSVDGLLGAVLDIENPSDQRVVRNSIRISRDPGAQYAESEWPWYLAQGIGSRVIEPFESERILIMFDPVNPMVRWHATAIYVWNPSEFEYRAKCSVDWLEDRGLAPSVLIGTAWRDESPDPALRVSAGTPRKHASVGR